jgi:hypothetical protein
MDFCAPCPVATGSQSIGVSMIVVGSAPIPALDGDFVQASRDTFDEILNYAQMLASFKQAGAEFAATRPLEQSFYKAAQETNARLAKCGLFMDMLRLQGERQNIAQPR